MSRPAGPITIPSRFMLVAAMNHCPCGYYGDPNRHCRCATRQIVNYLQRVSGPLLDPIDMPVEMPLVDFKEPSSTELGEKSVTIRAQVSAARDTPSGRIHKNKGVSTKAAM